MLRKVSQSLSVRSLINDMPIRHKQQLIKHYEDFCVRLMNGKDDCFALDVRQIF